MLSFRVNFVKKTAMILFGGIIRSFNHCIKLAADEHIPYLQYLSFGSLVILLILLCSLLSIDNRSVPPIEFDLMHYLTNQSLLMMPSREISPADSSLHRPKLVIDGILVVNDTRAVGEGHDVAALIVSYYFANKAVF